VRPAAAALAAALLALGVRAPASAPAVAQPRQISPVDVVDLEMSYDTLTAMYYRKVNPQRLLDGARVGIVAYLRGRGVADPRVPFARATGRYSHDLHALDGLVAQALLRYGDLADAHALVYGAIAGELSGLGDQYTVFYTPAQYRAFFRYLNPTSFGGIGVVVSLDRAAGLVRVDDVIPGGPAEKTGVAPGDEIAAIDGTSVAGLSADAIRERLRGAIGTVVRVSIVRGGVALPAPLPVVRAAVRPPDVFSRMLPDGVGYLQLTSYGSDAARQLSASLQRLVAQGARAYVLDLRDDGGGYRDVAIAVTSKFVARGPIVTVLEKSGRRRTLRADGSAIAAKPLVVLVNGNTASAAEITAGAIADERVGTLVGTRTYGKGLVQQIVPLPDGAAMKLTTERYLTAGGRDIDRKGIVPDVVVAQPDDARRGEPGSDPQLDRALSLLARRPPPSSGP
jgi:carboxyl-terminal processing protease